MARALWIEIVLGLLPVGVFLAVMTQGEHLQVFLNVILIVFLGVTGIGIASVTGILLRTRQLPKHFFGFCTGWVNPQSRRPLSLTQWLYAKMQKVANLPPNQPITFGELIRSGISLKMIATCLTFGRPYTLPFESSEFYFCPSEMKRFFPPEVVQWMVDHPGAGGEREKNRHKGTIAAARSCPSSGHFCNTTEFELPILVLRHAFVRGGLVETPKTAR